MSVWQEPAPAKLNLTLAVRGRRPDGYHNLESVMVPLALADRVIVRPAPDITVTADDSRVPAGPGNLAYQAAAALRQVAPTARGAQIEIQKLIPPAAGLGGGSADAAAVLRALNQKWGLHWPPERLSPIALMLGADVPFCLHGQAAVARGVGELLTPLPAPPPLPVVLAMPRVAWPGPKTATVFAHYRSSRQPDTAAMVAAIRSGCPAAMAAALGNALEATVCALHPVVAELKARMTAAGADGVAMTGAGPALFALCLQPETAAAVARAAAATAEWAVITALGRPAKQ